MAQITLGNFGRAAPEVARTPIAPADAALPWAAAHNAAGEGMRLADRLLDQYDRENDQVKRATAASSAQDIQTQGMKIAISLAGEMEAGNLHPRDAIARYNRTMDQIKVPEIAGLDEAQNIGYQAAIRQGRSQGEMHILNAMGRVSEKAQNQAASGFVESTTQAAILAPDPGSVLDRAAQEAQPGGILHKAYGADRAQAIVSDAYSKAWSARVGLGIEKAEATSNLADLEKIQAQLMDGESALARNLGERLPQALGKATSAINGIKAAALHAEHRRDADARRAFTEVASGLEMGVKFSPEQFDSYSSRVKGTEYEQDYKAIVEDAAIVLKASTGTLKDNEALLTTTVAAVAGAQESGDVGLAKRLGVRLASARKAAANARTLLSQEPITLLEKRAKRRYAPIDAQLLTDSNALKAELALREVDIRALRTEEGAPGIPMFMLRKDEADRLAQHLFSQAPSVQAAMLRTLRDAVDNRPDIYHMLVRQISPDGANEFAVAALRTEPKEPQVQGGPVAPGTSVGEQILTGYAAMRASTKPGADKAKEGYGAPGLDAFHKELSTTLPEVAKAAGLGRTALVEAARAYYIAGMMTGKFSPSTAGADIQKAIKEVAGDVVTFGKSLWPGAPDFSGSVFVPWGMRKDDFEKKISEAHTKAWSDGAYGRGKEQRLPTAQWRIFEEPGSNGMRYGFIDPSGARIEDARKGKGAVVLDISGDED